MGTKCRTVAPRRHVVYTEGNGGMLNIPVLVPTSGPIGPNSGPLVTAT